ncbi:MAG: ferritin-like domain-containing protein [Kofleriaceae bacterium]
MRCAESIAMLRTNFRQRLFEVVLLTAPATLTAGCFDGSRNRADDLPEGDGCYERKQLETIIAEPPPSELAMFVDACEADARDCITLCYQVLYGENSGASVEDCEVRHGLYGHLVKVKYVISTGEPGCGTVIDGRRPAGLAHAKRRCPDRTSGHLARAAFYEAASVYAFVDLARQLTRHGAPRSLIRAAQRSASEEVRHARWIGQLASERGAVPPRAVVVTPRRRSIESLAIENMREGVVGETWASVIALWQSRNAPTAKLRGIYARIAEDELRHAELSMAVDAWARTRLSPVARRRVDAMRSRAIAQITRGARTAQPRQLVEDLGLPDATTKTTLAAHARRALWG